MYKAIEIRTQDAAHKRTCLQEYCLYDEEKFACIQ